MQTQYPCQLFLCPSLSTWFSSGDALFSCFDGVLDILKFTDLPQSLKWRNLSFENAKLNCDSEFPLIVSTLTYRKGSIPLCSAIVWTSSYNPAVVGKTVRLKPMDKKITCFKSKIWSSALCSPHLHFEIFGCVCSWDIAFEIYTGNEAYLEDCIL